MKTQFQDMDEAINEAWRIMQEKKILYRTGKRGIKTRRSKTWLRDSFEALVDEAQKTRVLDNLEAHIFIKITPKGKITYCLDDMLTNWHGWDSP